MLEAVTELMKKDLELPMPEQTRLIRSPFKLAKEHDLTITVLR